MDVLTHRCPNFTGELVQSPLNLGHWWMITPDINVQMYLFMHDLTPVDMHKKKERPSASSVTTFISCTYFLYRYTSYFEKFNSLDIFCPTYN